MTHGGGFDGSDAFSWIIGIATAFGLGITILFEYFDNDYTQGQFEMQQSLTTSRIEVKKENLVHVEEAFQVSINGPTNVFRFWTGQHIHQYVDKDHFSNVYRAVALISAVLWSVATEFYTSNTDGAGAGDHAFGIVGCVANCSLWMATLSATFFAIAVSACKSNEELKLLVEIYGEWLLSIPLVFLIWGTSMLLALFFLYFSNTVDSGFYLTLAISLCMVIIPLFLHCLHKMGWALSVVHVEMNFRETEVSNLTPSNIREILLEYVLSKPKSVLHYDMEEFLDQIHLPGVRMNSGKLDFAKGLFNLMMKDALAKEPEYRVLTLEGITDTNKQIDGAELEDDSDGIEEKATPDNDNVETV